MGAATLLAELALAPALLCVRRSEGGLPFLWCVCCDDRIGRRDLLGGIHFNAGEHLLSDIDYKVYVFGHVQKVNPVHLLRQLAQLSAGPIQSLSAPRQCGRSYAQRPLDLGSRRLIQSQIVGIKPDLTGIR